MTPNTIIYNSPDWNTETIVNSFRNTGFLLVKNPFNNMKGTLKDLRKKLKEADLKTLPMYEEGRISTQDHPGEANERVVLRGMSGNWDCVNTIKKQYIKVGCDILYAIEEYMKIPPNSMTMKHKDANNDLIYVKYYKDQKGDVRLGSHCDFGTLTLVHVCDPVEEYEICVNDKWIMLEHPGDDFIIVNCGDFMQWWTQNKLKSTPHRISNSTKKERHSLIMFMDIDQTSQVHGITKKEWNDIRVKESITEKQTYHDFGE
tara:strand:+ start:330 stop:1106 length:777 start_codon:yes stop_codon:yes gene_type:complete